MCWLEVTSFWWSGVAVTTFFPRAELEAVLRWMTWIHVTSCDLIALGTGKCEGLGVNGSGVGTDYEGFAEVVPLTFSKLIELKVLRI
jgi:hypothetical protein